MLHGGARVGATARLVRGCGVGKAECTHEHPVHIVLGWGETLNVLNVFTWVQ